MWSAARYMVVAPLGPGYGAVRSSTNMLAVTTSLPFDQFAAGRKGAPTDIRAEHRGMIGEIFPIHERRPLF
jgi:hypothetical protein